MNCVLLIGRLESRPLLAVTSDGLAVATLLLVVPQPPSPEDPENGSLESGTAASCQEVPCVVRREQLPDLQAWMAEGLLLRVEGRLRRQPLWYERACGLCILQVHADRITPLPPDAEEARTHPSAPRPAPEAEAVPPTAAERRSEAA